MFRHIFLAVPTMMMFLLVVISTSQEANATGQRKPINWNRIYQDLGLIEPQDFQQFNCHNNMLDRIDVQMQMPVNNKDLNLLYPKETEKPYHKGYSFIMDVF
ncbi:hypothetical protein [Rubinisphaera italica]|uniref:Uncharacterized protein n=1 Tax=Rubinisphaera italica TaxID=2527969 RepID=A0A5C5XJV1_9PLAN|nr:hypothetical protein [Rubinisphaera italica]TWT62671.1 hypothetical protein Pan54_34150 [Rubinisphaera italica]